MGRRAMHTDETLLDAAVQLFAAGGAQAVTMVAVARATGAPSGSVYHRFPDRPALLAAMWLRTARSFQAGYLQALGEQPTAQSVIAAVTWTIDWCRAHPGPAALLQAGQRTLQPESWPADAIYELAIGDRAAAKALGAAARSVAAKTGRPRDEVMFAMLDLPLAVVRPYLRAGEPVPRTASDRVRRLATRILVG